jgi:hypothetical protein
MIGVRDDSLTTLASGEGEGVPLRVSSTGALHVTGGGGGTEYTEDVAAAGDPVGGAILLVRADTPATITDTDGDNVAQRATNYGAAYTQIVNSSGNFVDTFGGGTQYSVGVSGLTSAGTGTLMIATRDDALSALANGETEAIPARVDASGALWMHKYKGGSVIDSGNSTAGTIAANGDFIGVGVDLTGYASVAVNLKATEPSATDGMTFQFSSDNTNWDDTYTFTYAPSDTSGARRFQFPVTSQYFRVNWTQGPSAATARIQTILHTENILTSIHRLADDMSPDRSAQTVKSVLYAQAAGSGNFTAVDATAAGNLKVAVEEWDATQTVSVSDGAVVSLLGGTLSTSDGAVVAALGNKLEVSVGSTVTVAGTVTANAGSGTMAVSDGAVVSQLSGTLSVSDGAIVGILNSATDTTGALLVTPNVGLEASIAYHDQTVTTGSIAVSSGFTAGGAGQYNYITDVELTNSSATDTVVQLRDGVSGAVFWTMSVPANGGNNRSFARPLKQPTANTALAFDPLTAVTTIYISINGFQAQG